MPGNTKRRKPGRPAREIGKLPVTLRQRFDSDTHLKLVPLEHLDKILRGDGDNEAFCTLAYRLLVGEGLARAHFDHQPEAMTTMNDAKRALHAVGTRYHKTGRVGFTGDEYRALSPAINLIDDMQNLTTRRQQREAYRAVEPKVGSLGMTLTALEVQPVGVQQ